MLSCDRAWQRCHRPGLPDPSRRVRPEAGVPQLVGTCACLICSELHECLGVGVRACAHELLFCLVSTSYTYLVRNSESRAGCLESAAGHSPGRKLILQADCKRATAPVRRFVSTSAWSWSSRNRRRLDIPTSGDGVAARAELAPVISGRALLAAPDGEGVALQLVHVVQRVALVVVVARLDVLAWRGFLELPFASDDLDALDPLPVLLEIDVLDEE